VAIRSYADRATKRFSKGDSRRLPAAKAAKIFYLLELLDGAKSPETLRISGLRLHRLQPKHLGFYAVDVDRRLRISFRFEGGDAYHVRVWLRQGKPWEGGKR